MRPEGNYVDGLKDLIAHIAKNIKTPPPHIMIEIGSYAGESTAMFAEFFKYINCVDPYDLTQDPSAEEAMYAFQKRVEGLNVHLIRSTSDEAIKHLSESTHFVYIDGLHTYEQVKRDIENYLPLVRQGGFIGGHDYNWPEVERAVKDTLGTPHALFQDSSWLFQL